MTDAAAENLYSKSLAVRLEEAWLAKQDASIKHERLAGITILSVMLLMISYHGWASAILAVAKRKNTFDK